MDVRDENAALARRTVARASHAGMLALDAAKELTELLNDHAEGQDSP